ncbi:MAG: MFS transporter [Holosporaceae bacterium]|jgi:PAT family beta-lactamase induction signal transducer AmpG|nr:MFS transporter [Holosporaceae bacterium]
MLLKFFLKKFCVGCSYGTSFPLVVVILDYWLKDCGVSNSSIGFFTIFHLLFTLKFLWAHVIDNWDIPYLSRRLGRQKSWVIVSQGVLIGAVICMAHLDPQSQFGTLIFFASLISFADGCQNVALYPYQICAVANGDLGYVAGTISFGHRISSIFTKFVTLHMAHFFNWTVAYESAAFLILLCMIFILLTPEPQQQNNNAPGSQPTFLAIKKIYDQLLARKNGIFILLILALYKIAGFMIQKMSRPFCLEMGFTKLEIANVVQFFGSLSLIIGGFIGGFFVKKIGTVKTMLYLGILHMLSLYLYLLIWFYGHDTNILCIVVFFESMAQGATAAAFLAFLYGLCSGSSQYALLWALHEFGCIVATSVSGLLVDGIGWLRYFLIIPMFFIPGLWILHRKFPQNPEMTP